MPLFLDVVLPNDDGQCCG